MRLIKKLLNILMFATMVMPANAHFDYDWYVEDSTEGNPPVITAKSLELIKGSQDQKEKINLALFCPYAIASSLLVVSLVSQMRFGSAGPVTFKIGKDTYNSHSRLRNNSIVLTFPFYANEPGQIETLEWNIEKFTSGKLSIEVDMLDVGYKQIATFSFNGFSEALAECKNKWIQSGNKSSDQYK